MSTDRPAEFRDKLAIYKEIKDSHAAEQTQKQSKDNAVEFMTHSDMAKEVG